MRTPQNILALVLMGDFGVGTCRALRDFRNEIVELREEAEEPKKTVG